MHKGILLLSLFLSLTACVSMPGHRTPDVPLPGQWPDTVAVGDPSASSLQTDWWIAFGDPRLDRLMDEALAHNADLRLAAARIEEAQSYLGLTRGEHYPLIHAGAEASRIRSTEKGSFPIPSPINNTWRISLQAAFETDLWGRYRAATEAARAELLASRYAREVIRLALARSVAQAHFTLQALARQRDVARDSLANRQAAEALQRIRLEGGVGSELELRQAEAELAVIRASLATLEQRVRLQENALAVLLGRSPKALVESRITADAPQNVLPDPPMVPAGLPSDLLARRPDLRQAEQTLIAADARIDQARAALYPDLILTAHLGSESKALADLFSAPATIWGLTAGLVQTVFNAGRTEAAIQGAAARREQALLGYEQAVRQSFREVLDALVAQRQARERAAAEDQRSSALRRALELAMLRHHHGLAGYLEVLDAQRNLYQSEQSFIEARLSLYVALVDLSTALGGGWSGALEER